MHTKRIILLGLILLTGLAAPVRAEAKDKTQDAEVRYYAVFVNGDKVGRAKRERSVADGVVVTAETVQWALARMGTRMSILTASTARETVKGEPLGFEYKQVLNNQTRRHVGKRTDDGRFRVETETGTIRRQEVIDWPAGAVMSEGAHLLAKKKGLTKGTAYDFKLFMPATLKALANRVTVGDRKEVDLLGRVVELTEVKTATIMDSLLGQMTIDTTAYVNDDFEDLKAVQPMFGMDLEIVACSREFAVSPNNVTEFFDKLVLTSPKPLSGLGKAKSATYRLKPVGDRKISIPATDEQTARTNADGEILVTVRPTGNRAPAGAKRPYDGKDKDVLAAMKPAKYIQSDDKRVVELATKAVGEAKTPAEAAANIERFVRQYIRKKDLSVGYASAAEVAVSRQGDCSEHAVLVAAMCRSAGIPAQVVCGLAYVPRFGSRKDCFGPHAWARAWVGDRWIGLDAALDGFDAGHIALGVGDGDPEDYFGLVNTLGCFELADVTVQK